MGHSIVVSAGIKTRERHQEWSWPDVMTNGQWRRVKNELQGNVGASVPGIILPIILSRIPNL